MATGGHEDSGLPTAGWYRDVGNPARERLWTGERWIEWIRPARPGRVEADPAGWRPLAGRPGVECLWSGEMWTEETRRVGEASASAPPSVLPAPAATALEPVPRPLPAVLHHDARPPERLGTLGILVQIALGLVIVAAIVGLVFDQIYIGVLTDYLQGNLPSPSHTESVTDAARSARTVLWVFEAVTALAFLFWFYRAYRNLIRTGIRDVRFGPGWAVGGWFIPFFNLVRPKQVANDIWKGSVSAGTVGTARWREAALSTTINWWWGVWIFAGVMIAFGNRSITRASLEDVVLSTNLDDQRTGAWFMQIGLVALIVAAVLAILFVRQISRMQDENFKAVPAGNPDMSSPGHPWAVAAPSSEMAPTPSPAGTKTCPDCAEEIKAAARVCRYCGYRFSDPL